MRILHTADWHIGRTLEGRSRFSEHVAFFEELENIIRDEQIDVLLMAGDVFDSVNPPAFAEELFYESIARISRQYELPIAIIAGNHDHPERLAAARNIAKTHGIYITGYPGIEPLHIPVQDDVLQLAALPYPSEARMHSVFSKSIDEKTLRDAYNEKIKMIFQQLTQAFKKNHVRMAMSHVFAAGGSASDSERPIEVGGAYTITADAIPENVQYTALGHLHQPQNIGHSKNITRYSGSPLAFSFSESGMTKSVTIVDVQPHQETPEIKEIPLSSGKPLVRWEATYGMNQVKQWLNENKDADAWVELSLHMNETPSMEDIQFIRKSHPGIIHIYPVFPEMAEQAAAKEKNQLPIDELFQKFYEKQTGGAKADDDLIRLFMEMIEEEGEGE
ncbi:exonuclease SbcCD subunit D [Salibacterium salarium]|uniref:Nuclease SbcCD subunit D n=1 Tax=Salibacterium salarium TaxID=284579 RepID=A0A428N4P5_9BACI|nr:exonuclease SbcCD subunit D [Salibacterium salarium]RSL33381.1 exonuclease SbcCD subunit D [Salibacterium salarium]